MSTSLDGFDNSTRPRSRLLAAALDTLPTIQDAVLKFLACIRLDKARENSKSELWQDEDKFPEVTALNHVRFLAYISIRSFSSPPFLSIGN